MADRTTYQSDNQKDATDSLQKSNSTPYNSLSRKEISHVRSSDSPVGIRRKTKVVIRETRPRSENSDHHVCGAHPSRVISATTEVISPEGYLKSFKDITDIAEDLKEYTSWCSSVLGDNSSTQQSASVVSTAPAPSLGQAASPESLALHQELKQVLQNSEINKELIVDSSQSPLEDLQVTTELPEPAQHHLIEQEASTPNNQESSIQANSPIHSFTEVQLFEPKEPQLLTYNSESTQQEPPPVEIVQEEAPVKTEAKNSKQIIVHQAAHKVKKQTPQIPTHYLRPNKNRMPMSKLTEEDYPNDGHQEFNDIDMAGGHGTMAAPTMRVHGVTSRNVFVAPECPIAWVTVYLDKAEVCRCVRLGVAAGELTEVFFTKLSPSIDKDSIRVEVKGPAIIQDVNFMARRLQEDEAQLANAQHELKEKIKHAKSHQEIMTSKQKRLEKQRVVLDTFADTLIETRDNKEGKENGPIDAFDPKHMETLNSFFSLYGVQAEKLDEGIMQVKEEAEQTSATIKELEKTLRDLELRHDEQMVRELSVLVEAREAAQIELYFSYVVQNVKWTPTYDIRIFNSDGNMKIVYYGLVQQATGEDWEASQLVLSTSQPGVGGTVPDLGVQRVHFKSSRNLPYNCPMSPTPTSPSKKGTVRHSSTLRKSKRSSAMEPIMDAPNSVPSIQNTEDGELPITPHSTLKRPSDPPLQSTQFEVPRPPAIIPCDNEQHRVTVALVDLNPTFEYVSAPKRSPFAYLKANVQNTSKYAFLPGQTNIYVDNNFIGKSIMNAVAPNEDFSCYLGADHAIKVSYNPMFKYRETTGTGGKNASVTFKQIIELKNSHERPIKILVMDQLPMSAEDKIKVQLLEPVIKHPEKYDRSKPVRINKANNVEWDLEIQPNEVKELILRYVLEHPVTEEVDVSFSEV